MQVQSIGFLCWNNVSEIYIISHKICSQLCVLYFIFLWLYHKSLACPQCRRKTFMVHQTFVWWALYIISYKFVESPFRHLGLAIGNVRCVWRFSPTLYPCDYIHPYYGRLLHWLWTHIIASVQKFGVILKDMGKFDQYLHTTRHGLCAYFLVCICDLLLIEQNLNFQGS